MSLDDFLPPLKNCQYRCKKKATTRWAGMGFCAEHADKLQAGEPAVGERMPEHCDECAELADVYRGANAQAVALLRRAREFAVTKARGGMDTEARALMAEIDAHLEGKDGTS